mmetsp:Transcript_14742/g.28006  ORF Transcript_14742/g.28006 Transcript_14742/m.28006 type:complete len:200 (-) Transcript_14742:149-748(-)|eukprot:CAMPEP_0170178246 /NCGR_PEP_ID=MMETSP0040_2-20121228/11762_1 /TAXON_ID=641309 /ORGANISM="Lotharella oceanica, Strain CCMP622" /LENGTH=199 /DNA_ID=CAMNT_0010421255 /DNA_START=34 /DNA_END=633 /DNA_ORIENTATION=+
MSTKFTETHQSDSCAYCFEVLERHFDSKVVVTEPDLPKGKFPLFVTWKIRERGYWQLRGCIGTFGERSLKEGLEEYALISALKDPRFDPMEKSEMSSLAVNTSFLTDFEDAKHCYDWTIGTHGITISFKASCRSYSATYLPEVCKEQGWTKEECLDSLIKKAGYRGHVDGSFRERVVVTRYQSVKAKMTYKEYKEYRKP